MNVLNKHNTLIQHDNNFYRVLGQHKIEHVDKSRLGDLVKWYGGDKVLGYDGKYLICETIKDAEYEEKISN